MAIRLCKPHSSCLALLQIKPRLLTAQGQSDLQLTYTGSVSLGALLVTLNDHCQLVCTGDGPGHSEEEVESLRKQLAEALAGEEKHRSEAKTAHRQTDSAVAQLRAMQEQLDGLEVRPIPIS